jgi:RNA polymerase sigma-70 factor (sigma-E family)
VTDANPVAMEFTDYVRQQRDGLTVFATMLTGKTWLADDLVGDVLGRAFERWSHIAGLEHPHAYVRRMVVNEYLAWRRRSKWVQPVEDPLDYDRPVATLETGHAAREEMLSRLAALPRKQRAAVVLRYYLELSDAEIAEELGCREVTVRSHISHALRTLRIAITENAPPRPPPALLSPPPQEFTGRNEPGAPAMFPAGLWSIPAPAATKE